MSTEALPPAGTFRVPEDGVTVIPDGAVACHVTAWSDEPEDRTVSVLFPDSPGCMISDDGLAAPVAGNVGPYDGGAFSAPVPHEVSEELIVQSTVEPLARVENGT